MNKKTYQKALSMENKSFSMKVERFRDINKLAEAEPDEDLPESSEERSSSPLTNNVKAEVNKRNALKRKHLANRSAIKRLSLNKKTETTENLIEKVLQNQSEILDRLDNLEKYIKENVAQDCVLMANSLTTKECKVVIQKIHRSMIRIIGEDENALKIEIEAALPLKTIEDAKDMERKIEQNPEFLKALKLYLLQIKGRTGKVDGVLRKLMADELMYLFNYDGRKGKRALMQLTLINNLLSGIFATEGMKFFEEEMRRSLVLSHCRFRKRKITLKPKSV